MPQDLSIVGFDDTQLATAVWPELTTIRQPTAAMAEAALDMLLARLRNPLVEPPEVEETVLDYELMIRESSGPPPKSARGQARERGEHGAAANPNWR
ncbi:MAG: substrate-binding domain-containing protein [Sphingomonas sp.]